MVTSCPTARLDVHVKFESKLATDDVNFGIAINDVEGRLAFGTNMRLLEPAGPDRTRVRARSCSTCPAVPLLDGTYR